MEPKNEILSLIKRGRIFRDQAERAIHGGLHSKGAPIVGDFLISQYIPHGSKGTARKAVKYSHKSSRENAKVQWRHKGTEFLSECEREVKQMSINTINLTISGNSNILNRKFNRARRIKGPVGFFDSVINVLEEIQTNDLLWNKDISSELMRRKEEKIKEKEEKAQLRAKSKDITKLTKSVDLFDINSISTELGKYPTVQQSILGAIYSLQRDDPDIERQCITSCRAAIESLCIQLGGNNDWKTALNNLFPSDTDRKQVKGVWNYLSGRGAHGGHVPSKQEAEYSLQLTIATLKFIIGNSGKR